MKRWEYRLKLFQVDVKSLEAAMAELNAGGDEGWEVIGFTVIPQTVMPTGFGSATMPTTPPLGLACLKKEK